MTLTSGPSASDERSSGRPLKAVANEAYGQVEAAVKQFCIRDENEVTAFNDRYGWGGYPPIEERLLFQSERLKDLCGLVVFCLRKMCDAAAPSGVAGISAECSEEGLKDSASARRPDGQTGTGGQHEQG